MLESLFFVFFFTLDASMQHSFSSVYAIFFHFTFINLFELFSIRIVLS